jgi:hypothetical protein
VSFTVQCTGCGAATEQQLDPSKYGGALAYCAKCRGEEPAPPGPIAWSPREGGAVCGPADDGRVYLVEPRGGRWRWAVSRGGIEVYQSGAHATREDAQRNAEEHERRIVEDEMAKRKKKDEATKAAETNGAGEHANGDAKPELSGHQRPGGVQRARFQERLACRLTDDEVKELEIELASITCGRVVKEKELELVKETIKSVKERERGLVEQIQDGTETRNVDCVEMLYVETTTVDVVRMDTGEIVRSRAATADDLQEDMDRTIADRTIESAVARGAAAAKEEKPSDTEPPGPLDDPGPHDIEDPDDFLSEDRP